MAKGKDCDKDMSKDMPKSKGKGKGKPFPPKGEGMKGKGY